MIMQIVVNFDDHLCCDDELIQRIEGVIEGTLERFSPHVTQVEVHLSDLSGSGSHERDQSCRLEARLAGIAPDEADSAELGSMTVVHEAMTLTEAIHAAADKLKRALARELRQTDKTAARLSPNEETGGLFTAPGVTSEAGNPVR
jgi:hypothetical protein